MPRASASGATRRPCRCRSRCRRSQERTTSKSVAGRPALGRTVDQVRDGVNIVGGPAEIAERMTQYADLGIDRVYLQLLDLQDVDHVEYLGTEVLPQLPR